MTTNPQVNQPMEQLRALAWLKWRLFLGTMRSRRGAANGAASVLGTVAALGLSLLLASGLGFAAYALAGETTSRHASAAMRVASAESMIFLFGLLAIIFLMWALVPLSMGSGTQFDPGRLLLYPVSLRKLFAIDVVSELASLASIFAVPALLAVGVGAGLARGRLGAGVLAGACAALFGVAVSKLFATAVTALGRRRRGRAETLLALAGFVAAFSGVALQQGMRLAEGARSFPAALRWTPPGAAAVALTAGLRAGGETDYLASCATLLLYAFVSVFATYRLALAALRGGGAKKARAARDATKGAGDAMRAAGWRLPLLSAATASVFEKEMRYAARNAQLRVMILMPLVMTIALRFGVSPRRGTFAGLLPGAAPYLEVARAGFGVFYVFVIISALIVNCFGYEAGGMRALVLAPVPRRAILAGKNLSTLAVALASAAIVTTAGGLIYRDLTWRALLFAALSFAFFAAVFLLLGNALSLRFPKRLRFGKRMNSSGVAGLALVPIFFAALAPPALAVAAGWYAQSLLVEYVILASFACAAVAVYFLMIGSQARTLARRELDILEAVTGRDED